MPKSESVSEGGDPVRYGELIQYTDDLPDVVGAGMRQLGTFLRWQGAYFDAAAIMLQIPGAAEYRWFEDECDKVAPFIWRADQAGRLGLLAECLEQLECADLMDQVPGADDHPQRRVPRDLRVMLAERDANRLMNVVGCCLDYLLVIPSLDDQTRQHHDYVDPPGPRRRRRRKPS